MSTYLDSGINNLPRTLTDEELPDIAIGILSYNRAEEVLRSLDVLTGIDYPAAKAHLLVIDNASSDGTAEQVRERFGERVEIRRLDENMGGVARNESFMRRPERYVFQFDEDCAPARPETIRRAVEFLEANPGIGALCFRSVNLYTGVTEWGDFELVCRRRLRNGGYQGVFVIGNGMGFRTELVQRTRGYDPIIHWGTEEQQLGHELLFHDIPIVYVPDLAVLHRHAPRALPSTRVMEVEMRNKLTIVLIYYPLPLALAAACAHVLKNLLASVIRRKPGGVEATLNGLRQAIARIPATWPLRQPIPISRIAQNSRWFFATFIAMPPARRRAEQ